MVSTRQQTLINSLMVTRSGRYIQFVKNISLPKTKQTKQTKQTKPDEIEINTEHIDFDDAHNSWMENKRRLGNGTYVYICGNTLKNGNKCKRAQCDKNGFASGCKIHYMWEEKQHKYIYDDCSPSLSLSVFELVH